MSRSSPVTTKLANTLRQRVKYGDYLLTGITSERRLAEEEGVSYMTARKAVDILVNDGILLRAENGRAVVNRNAPQQVQATFQAAFVTPCYPSRFLSTLRNELTKAAEAQGGVLRSVEYMHRDCKLMSDAIDHFDGVILVAGKDGLPDRIVDRLKPPGRRVVTIGDSLDPNIVHFNSFPLTSFSGLLDMFREAGHRRVDCVNTQPIGVTIQRRIKHWQDWRDRHGFEGDLINRPVEPFTSPSPAAYEAVRDLLKRTPRTTAIVGLTAPVAIAAMRAVHDHGLTVGKDVSIASCTSTESHRYLNPALATLEMPDLQPLLRRIFDWFAGESKVWKGNPSLEPSPPPIFCGESIGPVPPSTAIVN